MTTQLKVTAKEINRLHSDLTKMAKISLETAMEIGRLLTDQKAALKHGEWLPWCKANLTFDRTSAYRYMKIFEGREMLHGATYGSTEAYRLLSQPSEPEEAEEGESEVIDASPEFAEDEYESEADPEPAEYFASEDPESEEFVDPEEDEVEIKAKEKPIVVIPSSGQNIAATVISTMGRLHDSDLYFTECLKSIIDYCEDRISKSTKPKH